MKLSRYSGIIHRVWSDGMGVRNSTPGVIFGAIFGLLVYILIPVSALSQTPFYEGKTITVIASSAPGGSADVRLRALVRYLGKHIPGNPTIAIEYMPGGGGRKQANYIYHSASPDGLTIGDMSTSMVQNPILGLAGVKYDPDKFIYLGSIARTAQWIFLSRAKADLNTLKKLQSTPSVRIGVQEVGHAVYIHSRFFAYLIGMKEPRFVTGYSSPEIDLALMRGEVDARAAVADMVILRNPDWIDKGLMNFHVVNKILGDVHPKFAGLPDLESFAKTDRERRLLALFRALENSGKPIVLPPGTPKERVQIMKEAMRKTFKDPEYHKEFKRVSGDYPVPLMAEEFEKLISELPRDPETVDLFKKLAGGDPLPLR